MREAPSNSPCPFSWRGRAFVDTYDLTWGGSAPCSPHSSARPVTEQERQQQQRKSAPGLNREWQRHADGVVGPLTKKLTTVGGPGQPAWDPKSSPAVASPPIYPKTQEEETNIGVCTYVWGGVALSLWLPAQAPAPLMPAPAHNLQMTAKGGKKSSIK